MACLAPCVCVFVWEQGGTVSGWRQKGKVALFLRRKREMSCLCHSPPLALPAGPGEGYKRRGCFLPYRRRVDPGDLCEAGAIILS